MAVTLGDAAVLALTFVLFVVVVSIGASVLSGIQSGQTANTYAYNATGFGLTGINNLANQSGVIGTILGAAILIGILLTAFVMRRE